MAAAAQAAAGKDAAKKPALTMLVALVSAGAAAATAATAVLAIVNDIGMVVPYAILGAVALGLNAAVIVLASKVSAQLHFLSCEMEHVARHPAYSLELNHTDAACDEVRAISRAFDGVATALVHYRSYVPQSALQQEEEGVEKVELEDEDDDTDEEDDDDEDEGGGALVGGVQPMNGGQESSDPRRVGTSSSEGAGGKSSGDLGPGLGALPSTGSFSGRGEASSSQLRRQSTDGAGKRRKSLKSTPKSEDQKKKAQKKEELADSKGPQHSKEVRHRHVGIMCVNMQGIQAAVRSDLDGALDGFKRYLATTLRAAKQTKGISDTFMGDRIIFHWNAAIPAPTYRKNCCTCALALSNDLISQKEAAGFGSAVGIEVDAHIGISSGRALCGEQGVPEMRRHTIFGECVTSGVLLCGAARHYKETILCDASMRSDCEVHFIFKCRARVYFPKSGQQIVDVSVLMRKRGVQTKKAKQEADAKDEEWMYRVEGAETNDPITLMNNSWEAWLEGDPEKARGLLEKCNLAPHQKEWLGEFIDGPDAENGKDHKDIVDPYKLL